MSVLAGVPPPLTEQADDIDQVWNLFLYIAIGVGALVAALMLFVMLRHRGRHHVLPRQTRENIPMELTYTAIPLLVVAGLFSVTFVSVRSIDEVDDDPDLVVSVTGFQWQWRFDYPESGVAVVGTENAIPELVLPAGETVRFELTSVDVIHSFWIPGFRFKRDTLPEETTSFEVDVGNRTGTYENTGVCAEFCGLDHARMRFSVSVVTPEEFDQWLDLQRAAVSGP